MRNLIPILLAVVVLSSGCDPDGYSCTSEGCYADDNSPQHLTLEDCLSVCDEITPKPGSCGSPVLHEGYLYSTVWIGSQCWFAENCRYIPEVFPGFFENTTDPYYYVYDYQGTDVEAAKATDNYATYGVLYNWPAVMTEGVCPSGWHIPSDGEFTQLTDFLGGEGIAGGKMKEAGYDHWNSPNTGATNSGGWTGLPGGFHDSGGFNYDGVFGYWWTASEASSWPPESWTRVLFFNDANVNRYDFRKSGSVSARCIRD